jgi:hypothetical protein
VLLTHPPAPFPMREGEFISKKGASGAFSLVPFFALLLTRNWSKHRYDSHHGAGVGFGFMASYTPVFSRDRSPAAWAAFIWH